MRKSMREISKTNFSPAAGHESTQDTIRTGCLQRIADAMERIATATEQNNSSFVRINQLESRVRVLTRKQSKHEREGH